MAKKTFNAKSLAAYRVSGNGTVVHCTGLHKQLADKKARKIEQKEDNRILDIIGVRY